MAAKRARKNAAVVQKPGAAPKPPKTDDKPAEQATRTPTAAEAAKAARVEGYVDPTKITKPVMTERGWLCPAVALKAGA